MDSDVQNLKMVASSDQALESTRNLARQLGAFRDELLRLDFSHEEMKDLVLDLQGMLLDAVLNSGK